MIPCHLNISSTGSFGSAHAGLRNFPWQTRVTQPKCLWPPCKTNHYSIPVSKVEPVLKIHEIYAEIYGKSCSEMCKNDKFQASHSPPWCEDVTVTMTHTLTEMKCETMPECIHVLSASCSKHVTCKWFKLWNKTKEHPRSDVTWGQILGSSLPFSTKTGYIGDKVEITFRQVKDGQWYSNLPTSCLFFQQRPKMGNVSRGSFQL